MREIATELSYAYPEMFRHRPGRYQWLQILFIWNHALEGRGGKRGVDKVDILGSRMVDRVCSTGYKSNSIMS